MTLWGEQICTQLNQAWKYIKVHKYITPLANVRFGVFTP